MREAEVSSPCQASRAAKLTSLCSASSPFTRWPSTWCPGGIQLISSSAAVVWILNSADCRKPPSSVARVCLLPPPPQSNVSNCHKAMKAKPLLHILMPSKRCGKVLSRDILLTRYPAIHHLLITEVVVWHRNTISHN